ncbi:hypothetical protein, partial [Halalkalibacterium halodurans]|uniref:hypothetical protein n=1 Tax=Halalkalibacterium halodurans TaxID=86665 RepID=UPI002E1C5586|nr:hypothetical protein [Halalkalibacterium halodurans]
ECHSYFSGVCRGDSKNSHLPRARLQLIGGKSPQWIFSFCFTRRRLVILTINLETSVQLCVYTKRVRFGTNVKLVPSWTIVST